MREERKLGMDALRPGGEHFSLMYLQLRLWQELLLSLALMLLLIAFVYFFNVPNPNMILVAGLVICSATFGYSGGLTAGLVMFVYTLFFFSTGNDFVSFSDINRTKVFVSLFGIVVDLVFVCELKRTVLAAFRRIGSMTETLQEDNRLLKEASHIDGLTGIRNRLALRSDFHSYCDRELFVMMMDIDNFKSINDTYGHDQGDAVLEAVGYELSTLFGRDHSYRYGGDEFIVFASEESEQSFLEKANRFLAHLPVLSRSAPPERVGCSIGYVYGCPADEAALRAMLSAADERMYQAKSSGKNHILGDCVNV